MANDEGGGGSKWKVELRIDGDASSAAAEESHARLSHLPAPYRGRKQPTGDNRHFASVSWCPGKFCVGGARR